MVIIEEKKTLRKKLLENLLSLTQMEVERRSKDVEKIISKLSMYNDAKVIMVYYPLKGEVSLLGIIDQVLGKKEVCFPVIDSKDKKLIPYAIGDLKNDFVKGPYAVMQPNKEKARQVPVEAIDVVFVPGIAFDRNKHRLGRGGGFYDRFIRTLAGHTTTIGVAYDFQILDSLPVNIPQDEKVDFIVTETDSF